MRYDSDEVDMMIEDAVGIEGDLVHRATIDAVRETIMPSIDVYANNITAILEGWNVNEDLLQEVIYELCQMHDSVKDILYDMRG